MSQLVSSIGLNTEGSSASLYASAISTTISRHTSFQSVDDEKFPLRGDTSTRPSSEDSQKCEQKKTLTIADASPGSSLLNMQGRCTDEPNSDDESNVSQNKLARSVKNRALAALAEVSCDALTVNPLPSSPVGNCSVNCHPVEATTTLSEPGEFNPSSEEKTDAALQPEMPTSISFRGNSVDTATPLELQPQPSPSPGPMPKGEHEQLKDALLVSNSTTLEDCETPSAALDAPSSSTLALADTAAIEINLATGGALVEHEDVSLHEDQRTHIEIDTIAILELEDRLRLAIMFFGGKEVDAVLYCYLLAKASNI